MKLYQRRETIFNYFPRSNNWKLFNGFNSIEICQWHL